MNYQILVETTETEEIQEQIYREVLLLIINECLSEVLKNEESHNIFKSID